MNRLSTNRFARASRRDRGHGEEPLAKFPAHGEDRARLDDDLEDLRLLAEIAEQRAGDDEVAGRGNGEEFGETFDQAQQQCDE